MPKNLILLDVDGTLAPSTHRIQSHIECDLVDFMEKYEDRFDFGIVGGSSFDRICWQLGAEGTDSGGLVSRFKWLFSENGLVAHRGGTSSGPQLIHKQTLRETVPEKDLQCVIDWSLRYIADLDIPCKRGKFIDFRSGLIYITPCGSNVNQEERDAFAAYDAEHRIRETMIKRMHTELGDKLGFDFQLGGQIGLGAHPRGWDKTYCLRHLLKGKRDHQEYLYDKIYFVGDRCSPRGNDYPLYAHVDTVGYATSGPDQTMKILEEIVERS